MFHIFVGVYPNDKPTTDIIKKLQKEYSHIHPVTHVLNGPSSKADNINNVLENIKVFEQENKCEFQFFVIHDSEDIIHPYEFHLENYLLETHAAVQIPVFPLQEKPKLNNLIKNMVTGTYADEFAENHYRTMNIRNMINAFVPSAGTGFAIHRKVLEKFEGDVFPVGSLTEDYKLSMEFKKRGFHLYYPLEHIVRIDYQDRKKLEYIATRSMFPKTYKAAVRQKTRWIHGITMQSFKLRELIFDKKLNIQTRYSFYKDWKAKFGNLLILPSYLVFIYFIVSLFTDLPIMYPKGTVSWYLMLSLTLMMIHRQFIRFRAVFKIYGLRSGFISTFLPPVIPFRLLLGNIINFHATFNAWINHLNIKGKLQIKDKQKSPKKTTWAKTDHEFLDSKTLDRFRLKLGDKLISMEKISPGDLKRYLKRSYEEDITLRALLLRENVVQEEDILEAAASVLRKTFYSGSFGNYFLTYGFLDFDKELLEKFNVAPLFINGHTLSIIGSIDSDIEGFKEKYSGFKLEIICTTNEKMRQIFNGETINIERQNEILEIADLVKNGLISASQSFIALDFTTKNNNFYQILETMGFNVIN